jgi:hypothetical protein
MVARSTYVALAAGSSTFDDVGGRGAKLVAQEQMSRIASGMSASRG